MGKARPVPEFVGKRKEHEDKAGEVGRDAGLERSIVAAPFDLAQSK